MKILIKGGTKYQKGIIDSMVPFLCKNLFPKQYKKVSIEFFVTHIDGYSASTIPHPEYLKSPWPKHFQIEIHNKLPMVTFRKVLCHEMVHLNQYVHSHLEDYSNGTTRYKDKKFSTDEVTNPDLLSYWTAEFEEEARGKEDSLYFAWRKWRRSQKRT